MWFVKTKKGCGTQCTHAWILPLAITLGDLGATGGGFGLYAVLGTAEACTGFWLFHMSPNSCKSTFTTSKQNNYLHLYIKYI